ncbi:MAG: hypothetical protein GY769_03820 [bacterium]|nr:hypothetical protein [bacterium]
MTEPARLRHLVACVSCLRQFDASGHEGGSRFHCVCGEVIEVREPRPHESAVVRCSACGAPRLHEARSCQFCGSHFTLREQDLDTICPGCAARISREARYCHACALPIAPQGTAGETVEAGCPACGSEHRLSSRALGEERLTILECPRCAGLWLGGPAFQHLEEKARERALDWTPERTSTSRDRVELGNALKPLYRPCPDCNKLMNRRNYGQRSGVIVDVCTKHGVWFDMGELARILSWIRDGGLAQAQKQELIRNQAEARRPAQTSWPASSSPFDTPQAGLGGLLKKVLDALLT